MRRGALAIAAALVACNAVLGIEEGPAKPAPEDAGPDVVPPPPVDAKAPAPTACKVDADCIPPNGCYTGRCDVIVGACAYARCETKGKACSAGTCTAKLTCASDRDYNFVTTKYKLDSALGCKASAQACIAAAFPFVLIGTKDETIALVVDDLLAPGPTKVPVGGLRFRPAQLIASGRRVWILGEVTGGAPPYQLQVAWIDVPSDPTTASLVASSTTLAYPFPYYVVFPAPGGDLFLALNDASAGFPAARLTPPLPAMPTAAVVNTPDAGAPPPATVPMFRLASAPPNANLVASSGERLVIHRFGAQVVNLLSQPATAKVALGADLALTPAIPALVTPHFGQGPDGTVFTTGPVVADAPAPDCNCGAHQRIEWTFPNAIATAVDVNQLADFEGYVSPQVPAGLCHQCNPTYVTLPSYGAWIDPKTVIVAAPATDPDRTLTSTRIVTRDPLAAPGARHVKTAAGDVPPGNFATDRVAITSSAGFGYELLADSEGNNLTFSIFDPRCDAK